MKIAIQIALLSLLVGLFVITLVSCGDFSSSSNSSTNSNPVDDDVDDDLNDDVDDDTLNDDAADDDTVDDDVIDDDTADDDSVDDDSDDDVTDDDTVDDDDDTTPQTVAGGKVFRFDWTFDYLAGGEIEVLEYPDIEPVVADADGAFSVEGVRVGRDMSLIHRHDEFYPTQTATLIPDEAGIEDISFQAPPRAIVWGMSIFLWEWLDPDACQIATTVTEADGTPFTAGIAGATVSINPSLPPEQGPFYFMIVEIPGWPMLDLPVRDLAETTGDGGAVFINVPPGEYVLSAEMPGEQFTTARLKCTPGMLVNASPPYGLQRIE